MKDGAFSLEDLHDWHPSATRSRWECSAACCSALAARRRRRAAQAYERAQRSIAAQE